MKILVLLLALVAEALPAASPLPSLPPLREQARIQQQWLSRRLSDVLPALMRKFSLADSRNLIWTCPQN